MAHLSPEGPLALPLGTGLYARCLPPAFPSVLPPEPTCLEPAPQTRHVRPVPWPVPGLLPAQELPSASLPPTYTCATCVLKGRPLCSLKAFPVTLTSPPSLQLRASLPITDTTAIHGQSCHDSFIHLANTLCPALSRPCPGAAVCLHLFPRAGILRMEVNEPTSPVCQVGSCRWWKIKQGRGKAAGIFRRGVREGCTEEVMFENTVPLEAMG